MQSEMRSLTHTHTHRNIHTQKQMSNKEVLTVDFFPRLEDKIKSQTTRMNDIIYKTSRQ